MCTPRENPGYAYEKRVPALRWYGASRMVSPALSDARFPAAVRGIVGVDFSSLCMFKDTALLLLSFQKKPKTVLFSYLTPAHSAR